MNEAEIETKALNLLLDIAPDIDRDKLKRDVPFREQFDFDSMDTLNYAIALSKTFAIEVPETAYPQMTSLAKTVAYVQAQLEHCNP